MRNTNIILIGVVGTLLSACAAEPPVYVPPVIPPRVAAFVIPTDKHGCTDHDWYFAEQWVDNKSAADGLRIALAADRAQSEQRLERLRAINTPESKIQRHSIQQGIDDNDISNMDQTVQDDWQQISKPCQLWLAK